MRSTRASVTSPTSSTRLHGVPAIARHERRDRAHRRLGIELVRLLMDEFRHEYSDGCNVLMLRKKL